MRTLQRPQPKNRIVKSEPHIKVDNTPIIDEIHATLNDLKAAVANSDKSAAEMQIKHIEGKLSSLTL